MNKSDKIQLLSQGSYGCVFHPGSTCRGNIENKNFVRKIQADNDNNQKEIKFGQKIKKIKHFKQHFAPIIDSCPVSIGSIDNDEIKKCDIINNTNIKYVSNKISFVGDKTLGDYLLEIYEDSPKNLLKMIFQTHIDLIDSVHMLSEINIIHMDLKENNVMMNSKKKPIIIDFGLSIDITEIKTNDDLKINFWIFDDYLPWCFDINIINSITQSHNIILDSTYATENDINLSCKLFIDNSELLHLKFGDKPIFNEKELDDFKANLIIFMKPFINNNWKSVIDSLLKFSHTWDIYALSYIYLSIIKNSMIYKIDNPFIHSYIGLLKKNILSTPDKRFDAITMKKELLKISQNINKSDIHKIHDTIHKQSTDKGFFDLIQQNHAKHTLQQIEKENKFYNKI